MIAGGARMVSGSDWPVSTPDPWQALHVAVNRTDPEYGGEPLNPEQALSLEVAWRRTPREVPGSTIATSGAGPV